MTNNADDTANDLAALRVRLCGHRRELVCRLAAAGALDAGLVAMLADAEAGIRAVDEAMKGDVAAAKEFADRVEGEPTQGVVATISGMSPLQELPEEVDGNTRGLPNGSA